jgi:hypothetical protein
MDRQIMERAPREVIIQGLDIMEVIGFITKKNKRYQAMSLQELETILPADSEEFKMIRKLFLDGYNDYTRSILRIIFGDIEYLSQYDGRT